MDTEIMVEAHPILGVCNLCLNEGAVKSMLVPHINMGKSEIYSKMLLNCFSIDISQTELGDTKRLICFLCIDKLRECETFRTMVQQSLNTLKENAKLLMEDKVANIKEEFDDINIEDNDLDENVEEKVANIKEEVDDIDIEHNTLDDVIHKDDDLDENAEEKVANIKEEVDDIDIEDNNLDYVIHKNDDLDENDTMKTRGRKVTLPPDYSEDDDLCDDAEYMKPKRRRIELPPREVAEDGIGHWPKWAKDRQRCKICNLKSSVYCSKCTCYLCLNKDRNCFKSFHVIKIK